MGKYQKQKPITTIRIWVSQNEDLARAWKRYCANYRDSEEALTALMRKENLLPQEGKIIG